MAVSKPKPAPQRFSGYQGFRACAGCGTQAYCRGQTYDTQFCQACIVNPSHRVLLALPRAVRTATPRSEQLADVEAMAAEMEELAEATKLAVTRIARIVRSERRHPSGEWPALMKAVERIEERHGVRISTLSRATRAVRRTT